MAVQAGYTLIIILIAMIKPQTRQSGLPVIVMNHAESTKVSNLINRRDEDEKRIYET